MKPIIRPAVVADAAAIARTIISSWRETYRNILSKESLESLSLSERTECWTQRLQEQTWPTLVCEVDEAVIGFACYSSCQDEDKPSIVSGELVAIYLLPEYFGKGLGAHLFKAACSQLSQQGFSDLVVWVLEGNTLGITFYEKMGLTRDGASKRDTIRGSEVVKIRYLGKI
jgi:L-amino acid N-acyltransferase YncA